MSTKQQALKAPASIPDAVADPVTTEETRDAKVARLMATLASLQQQVVDTDTEYKAELRAVQEKAAAVRAELKATLDKQRNQRIEATRQIKNCQPLDTADVPA